MDHLFQLMADKSAEISTNVTVSYLEIYNEAIRDLLSDKEPTSAAGLAIRKDNNSRVSVAGLTEQEPASPEAIQELIDQGNRRRRTEKTNANATSSRSHAVLQINVRTRPRSGGLESQVTFGTLSIIDLAGSERASATQNLGARMKEGSAINKSLLSLGNCINALAVKASPSGRSPHIPYRDSKLTRLLEFSLGGNCKTVMIVCVSPSSVHYEDTHNTLKYADRAKKIKTAPLSRNTLNVQTHVRQYVEKISELTNTVRELQLKLAGKADEGTALMERRRSDMLAEVDRARADVQSKAEQTRTPIVDGAVCETLLIAAEARLRPIRVRLAELDRTASTSSTPGMLAPSLAAERDLLRRVAQPDEDLLKSAALQHRLGEAAKAASMFGGVVRAVSERRMDKLDALAVETLKGTAALSHADMELLKARAGEARLREGLELQAERTAQLAGLLARAMGSVRDARERLQQAGAAWTGDESHEVEEVAQVASVLGHLLQANTTAFDTLIARAADSRAASSASGSLLNNSSSSTSSIGSAPQLPPSFSLSFPSATLSFPSAVGAPSSQQHPPASALHQAPVRRARTSLAGSSFAQSAAGYASPGRRSGASRASLLLHHSTKSLGSPARVPSPRKKPSSLAGGAIMVGGGGGGAGKKAGGIRWKDEAGEGDLDDAARLSLSEPEETEDPDAEWEDLKDAGNSSIDSSSPPNPSKIIPSPPSFVAAPPSASTSKPTLALPGRGRPARPPTAAVSLFASVPEDNELGNSSPGAGPSRRAPLGDALGGGANSSFSSSSFSLTGKPAALSSKPFSLYPSPTTTATSTAGPSSYRTDGGASRNALPSVAGLAGAPKPYGRRISAIGPDRSARASRRTSQIPSPPQAKRTSAEFGIVDLSAPGGGARPPAAVVSAMGGGARRVLGHGAPSSPLRTHRLAGGGAGSGKMPGVPGRVPRASNIVPVATSAALGGPIPSYMAPTAARKAALLPEVAGRR